MKTYFSHVVIALLMINALTAQVKIGDNPETLNPASVLELESTSRVLVITRVSDAQMNLINPLRGALVYNTDHNCLHYYTGTEWVNICEALDNSFTVSTLAEYMRPINPNALDNTVVITETPNPDGSVNYNFEVGILNGANIAPSAINGDKIQNGSVGSQDLAPKSVGLTHLQDGGADGDLFQWNGSVWELINEADISITEADGIIGNEVVDATDGTLTRTGNGTDIPYTLGVSPLGIGTNELADDSVTNEKINANVAGAGLVQNGTTGALEVDVTQFSGDGSLTSTNNTISISGTPADALFEDVQIDVANNSITSAMIIDGEVAADDIANDAVTNEKINANVAGNGLNQAADGSLEVVVSDLTGDGSLTSPGSTIELTGTPTNALLENVGIDVANNAITNAKMADNSVGTIELLDDSVTAAKIAVDVAGNGLTQAADGSLDVDALVGEVTGPTNATVIADDAITNAKMADNSVGTIELIDDSVTAAKIAGDVAGNGLVQAADGSLEVVVSNLTGDGSLGSPGSTIEITGTPTNALLENVDIDVADNAITNAKMADNSVGTTELIDDSVTADKLNVDVAGTGLVQNATTGALEVDVTQFGGDGSLTSTNNTISISGTSTDALFEDVQIDVANNSITSAMIIDGQVATDDIANDAVTTNKIATGAVESTNIAADAVNAATINVDVAGAGLVQNVTTGALEVDVTQFGGDGSLTSTNNTISISGTSTDALFEDVQIDVANNSITSAMIIDGQVATDDIVNDAVTTNKILDGTIATVDMADGAVTTDKILDGTIATVDIADDAVTVDKIAPSGSDGQVLTTIAGNTVWRSPYHAIGKMNGSSQTRSIGVSNVTPIGTGNYQVIFSSSANTSDYVIQLTLKNAGPETSIEVVAQTTNDFTVQISDNSSGSPTAIDAEWFFTVTDF